MDPHPVTLEGRSVRLEPLEERHADDLFAAGNDDAIWRYMPCDVPASVAAVRAMIRGTHAELERGSQVPFAIVEKSPPGAIGRAPGRAIGSTRYLDIRREHRGLEIGWTWLGRAWQRTAANTECKLLLLEHAFEALGALRVQLKTDARNLASQRAIERIGAVREGVLRAHMVVREGFVRDSVMYAVTAGEWPEVKGKLEGLLGDRKGG